RRERSCLPVRPLVAALVPVELDAEEFLEQRTETRRQSQQGGRDGGIRHPVRGDALGSEGFEVVLDRVEDRQPIVSEEAVELWELVERHPVEQHAAAFSTDLDQRGTPV